jgi:hypothetical protein
MFRCAGQAGGGPLMSNVRPHENRNVKNQEFNHHCQEQVQFLALARSSEELDFLVERQRAGVGLIAHEVQYEFKLRPVPLYAGRPSAGGRLTCGCSRTESISSSLAHACSGEANWSNE